MHLVKERIKAVALTATLAALEELSMLQKVCRSSSYSSNKNRIIIFNQQQQLTRSHLGGVSVMLWNSNGIRVWFFQRGSIPADITAQQPNPDRWGKPYARFDFGAECPSWHFSNHVIIFNIAMCGDWAGGTFWSSCPGLGSCASYVQNNPRAFSEAYWLINSLRVYQPRA